MKIPKIIHQTWKDEHIPQNLKVLSDTWKEHHPDWQYFLWTDRNSRTYVEEHFPELLDTYNSYEANIQRADIIRYMFLYKMGGVYADIDFECYDNFEDFLGENLCVLSAEPPEHCQMHKMPTVICNAFMASVPKHSFMRTLIEGSLKPVAPQWDPNKKVMESTGPYMVTREYNDFTDKGGVTILESKHVYPLTRTEVFKMMSEEVPDDHLQDKLDNCMAVHYWMNSWPVG